MQLHIRSFRLLYIGILLMLTGCGGDLGAPTGLVTRAVVSVEFNDATATRPITSFVLKIPTAGPAGSDVDLVFPHTPNPAAGLHKEMFGIPYPIPSRTSNIVAQFLGPVAKNVAPVVSTVQTQVQVMGQQTTISITLVQPIQSITVVSGQTVRAGSTVPLEFSALDRTGQLVAVAPEDISITCADTSVLKAQQGSGTGGTVTGESTGTTTATVKILTSPGTVSAPQPVRVWQLASLGIAANQTVLPGTFKTPSLAALDTTGQVVSIAEGDAKFTVVDGAQFLGLSQDDTQIIGLQFGTAHIYATVGSVQSPLQAISVIVPQTITITPQNTTLTTDQQFTFTASVAGTADTQLNWRMTDAKGNPVTGSQQGTIQSGVTSANYGILSQTAVYTAPAVAGTYYLQVSSPTVSSLQTIATIIVNGGNANFNVQ